MLLITALAVVIAAGLGLLAKFVFAAIGSKNSYGERPGISWAEYATVSLLMAAVFAPAVSAVGNTLSVNEIVTYTQWVNGTETNTRDDVTTCYAGHSGNSASAGRSNCEYAYVSGSYTWTESHTRTVCSGSGSKQKCTTERYYTTERADIYSPYATREHRYGIDSSMGAGGNMSYTFPYAYLDASPVPFNGAVAIPGTIPRGAPADWTEADTRLKAGDPRAVSKLSEYPNYILASGDEVLKTFGPKIDAYKAAGLLPDHTANINADPVTGPSRSQADKVSFVGVKVADPAEWQRSVMRLNAALGMKLQGDLHVVLVDSATVPSTDSVPYTTSLKAYWQSDAFGKRAIAKNAIILVLGVNTQQGIIDWSNASTGMPFGNESMIQYLRDDLPGKALKPDLIFGSPKTTIKPGVAPDKFTNSDYTVTLSTPRGIVENIVFELAPFKRARMSCDDGNCVGYKDLLSKIEPTAAQKTIIIVITGVIAIGLWLIVGFTTVVDDVIARMRGRQTAAERMRARQRSQRTYYGSYRY